MAEEDTTMEEPVEFLVTRRSRRSTAGNRMEAALAEMALDTTVDPVDDDQDFVNDKEEEDVFGSDFASTDEEAQDDADAGEKAVEEEERRAKKDARSKVEKATAVAHARQKVTFNPQAEASTSQPKPKDLKRRVSLGPAVNAETGEVLPVNQSSPKKKRHSQRRHTILATSAAAERLKRSEEKKAAMPKKAKIESKAYTQAELIALALDNEEGNIIDHRDYLKVEEERRKRARVVRTAIDGPLIRWISRGEEIKVVIPPPPAPPFTPGRAGFTYNPYGAMGSTPYSQTTPYTFSAGVYPHMATGGYMSGYSVAATATASTAVAGPSGASNVVSKQSFQQASPSAEPTTNSSPQAAPLRTIQSSAQSSSAQSTPQQVSQPTAQLPTQTTPHPSPQSASQPMSQPTIPQTAQLPTQTTPQPAPQSASQPMSQPTIPQSITQSIAQPTTTQSTQAAPQPTQTNSQTTSQPTTQSIISSRTRSTSQPPVQPTTPSTIQSTSHSSTPAVFQPGPQSATSTTFQITPYQSAHYNPYIAQLQSAGAMVWTPPPPPAPVERIEKVTKNYIVHELAQNDGVPKPPWNETMMAMFGDHVDWSEVKVFVGKNRPLSRPKQMCPITGKEAKYLDPRTGVPYADLKAYDVLTKLLAHEYAWNPSLGCYIGQDNAGSAPSAS